MALKPKEWADIRRAFEQTAVPILTLARNHNISDAAIHRRAKRERWIRFRVSGSAEDLQGTIPPLPKRELRLRPPREIVRRDNSAAAEAAKQSDPQQLIARARDMVERLISQLDDAIGNRDSLLDMIEEWNDETGGSQKYEALHKAMGLPSLTLAAKNLAGAVKLLADPLAGKRIGKKEREQAEATELAQNSPFAKRRLPPKQVAVAAQNVEEGETLSSSTQLPD